MNTTIQHKDITYRPYESVPGIWRAVWYKPNGNRPSAKMYVTEAHPTVEALTEAIKQR